MKNNVTCVVLAGGEGKRFWPLLTNKVLFPFFGKPLFDYSVRDVLPKEVDNVVIVARPSTKVVYESLTLPVKHSVVVQEQPLGMADALLQSKEFLPKHTPILIAIADDVADPLLFSELLKTAAKKNAFGVIPGWKVETYHDLGYLVLDGERVTSIVEKPSEGNEPSSYVYISGQYISDCTILFDQIEKISSEKDDVFEKAVSRLMEKNLFVMHPYSGSDATLKLPWHVLDVMDQLFLRVKSHRGKNVVIKSNVVIEGEVYIDDDVKIYENTKIVGPAYIGRGTIVGNNNMIRHSHIGAGCVTGFNTDITRSYVGDSCWFHMNYIGDSVLESEITLGGGAMLANLRLDDGEIRSEVKGEMKKTQKNKLGSIIGRGVRIGANTTIMPGIKIGKGTLISSGLVIDRDIPDGSFVKGITNYTIVSNKDAVHPLSRDEFKKKL
ncbi:NTP transferase domain-containing protein [Candidatus Gottesmanbacteria bacterium]|nr:NTP transferase domain-containing protein [Candidatus Gottesmanbacteria bacterium]